MTPTPTTAADVLAEMERTRQAPVVDGRTLVVPAPLPDSLLRSLHILHTGVRALLTNQTWFGCSCESGWSTPLSPELPVPDWIGLFCVAGDATWHRVPPLAPEDRVLYFTRATEPKPGERQKVARGNVFADGRFGRDHGRTRTASFESSRRR